MSVPILPSSSGSAESRGSHLDLEALSEGKQEVKHKLVIVRIRLALLLDWEAAEEEHESDREVERVNGRLVEYNCLCLSRLILDRSALSSGVVIRSTSCPFCLI
jgi:hypothetical protein